MKWNDSSLIERFSTPKDLKSLKKTVIFEIPIEEENELVKRINHYFKVKGWSKNPKFQYHAWKSEPEESYRSNMWDMDELIKACFDIATDMACKMI